MALLTALLGVGALASRTCDGNRPGHSPGGAEPSAAQRFLRRCDRVYCGEQISCSLWYAPGWKQPCP